MPLPTQLVESIRSGRVVLCLGAGASIGATRPDGSSPPDGRKLRDLLCDRFLVGTHKDESLAWVAELAFAQADQFTVQDFVAEQFRDLRPAPFHLIIPTVRWRGIVSTNYDRVVEDAFASSIEPVQNIVPILSNSDRYDSALRDSASLGLIKLHGCITRTHDIALPLILSTDSYATHREGRQRLYGLFYEWAAENPVVYVGQAGQDFDLRSLMIDVDKEIPARPMGYMIRPGISQHESLFWHQKRYEVINLTLEQFLKEIDSEIPKDFRKLAVLVKATSPIEKRFITREKLSTSLENYLRDDVLYVHGELPIDQGDPKRFFKGFDLGWYPIANRLDVRRRITDRIFDSAFLITEDERSAATDFYLIKAEAGSGKSLLLRRLAWEAADGNLLCLYARPGGTLRSRMLRELHRLTGERIFLFVDNAADCCDDLARLLAEARQAKLPLTVLAAARTNEWNVACDEAARYVTEEFPLKYLSRAEIERLVALLDKHHCLGPNLVNKTLEQRIAQFEERAGRQILVALHEATLGEPFEQILVDEYAHVQPAQAKSLYLTVCTLNRLDVPVRAGLVARVHGIAFDEFQRSFLKPLEHVVIAQDDPVTGDMAYRARHPEIAEIVFEKILTNADDRFHEYIRVVKNLNRSFSSDNQAFRMLVRARTLHDYFPRYEDVRDIYKAAEEANGRDAFLCQQMANYERIRPNGSLRIAFSLLEEARALDPRDLSIIHTLAELTRTKAESSDTVLERRRYRTEAIALLQPLLHSESAAYARATMFKLAIDELSDTLSEEASSERSIDNALRAVERNLDEAIQQFPADRFLRIQEERFARLVNDDQRAYSALKAANKTNPRDPYIARRLALVYKNRNEPNLARQCIETALASNRGDKVLNFALGELIWGSFPRDAKAAAYHFRRAFTDGDANYEARFWYARCVSEGADEEERRVASRIFREMRSAPVAHDAKIAIRDVARDISGPIIFAGRVARLNGRHGMIEVTGGQELLFFHSSQVQAQALEVLCVGRAVRFQIGYALTGPQALDVTLG